MRKLRAYAVEPRNWALLIVVAALASSAALALADTENISTTVTVGNSAPVIDSITLNGGSDINVTENTFKYASTTITITDANGCDTISSVEARLYHEATTTNGTDCAENDLNCYDEYNACAATTTGNTCTGGADTQVQYDCSFRIWYLADPTDSGTSAGDVWAVSATTSDSSFATTTATNTGETVELITLLSHNITEGSIAYDSTAPGADTGTTDETTTITNTGNAAQDTQIGGDVMCTDFPTCDVSNFGEGQQKFDLTAAVTYASKTFTMAASVSPATIETVLAKPSATTSAVTDIVYWGIGIPSGQATGDYTGQNDFIAASD